MVNGVMAVTRINLKNGHGVNNNNDTVPIHSNNTTTHDRYALTASNNNNIASNSAHTTDNDNDNDSNSDNSTVVFSVPTFNEFITDFNIIRKCVYSGPVTSYRLVYISVFPP